MDAVTGSGDASRDRDALSGVDAVLAEVDGLVADRRHLDAVEALTRALSVNGSSVVLLRRLAWVERLLDHNHLALTLLLVADGIDNLDLETKIDKVRTLVELRQLQRAMEVLVGLPASVGQDPRVRATRAEVYQAMGLPTLALDAYGERRTLWRGDRRVWCRLWWCTGGPLWLVRRRLRRRDNEVLRGWPADPPPGPDEPMDTRVLLVQVQTLLDEDRRVGAVLDRVERLLEDDEFGEAADTLTRDLASNGPSAALLGRLAWVEQLRGRGEVALAHLAEARRVDPSNLDILRQQATTLIDLERFRDVLTMVRELSPAERTHRDLRGVLGRTYWEMGLPTLAVAAYCPRWESSKWQRRQRRRYWWRSGGPLRLLLWRPRRFEQRVLRSWRSYSRNLRVLDTLCWPSGFDPAVVRSRLDWYSLRGALLWERWWSIRWFARAGSQAAAVFVSFLVLRQVASRALTLPGWLTAIVAVVGSAVAFALFRTWIFRIANINSWPVALLRGAPIGLALVGAGYAAIRFTWPAKGWSDVVGAVPVAAVGIAALFFVVMTPAVLAGQAQNRKHWRRGPREDILDELLDVLDDLANPTSHNDLDRRAVWIWRLERAAVAMEKRLPAILYVSDDVTTTWTAERARGAATALRRLKRQVVAPVDGTWDRMAEILGDEIVALTTGELGRLRWAGPPDRVTVRRSWWTTTIIVVRTVALAAAPLAAVLAVQPLLHLDPAPLRWAKVIGFAWAVLYLLLAADPNLREKIETAQSLSNLFNTTRREPGRSERPGPPESGGRS